MLNSDSINKLIDGPVTAIVLYAAAILAATAFVRYVPIIRRTMTEVEATRQSPIDGLRGFLGIGVFIHHVVFTWVLVRTGEWQLPHSRLIVHLGHSSVCLFFMITAYIFWSRVLARGRAMDWADFFISRLYRLYPAYLLMVGLLAFAAVEASGGLSSRAPFWRPLLGWIAFTMFTTPDLNGLAYTSRIILGVTWSLRFEWLFYIALPLLAFAVIRKGTFWSLLFSALGLFAVYSRLGWTNPFGIDILQGFLGGIAAAHWARYPMLKRISRTTGAGFVALAALAAVIICLPTPFIWEGTIGLTVFFVVVASGFDFWGILRRRGLLWLGDITYSIYLLHGLLLWLIFHNLVPSALSSNAVIYLAVTAAITPILVAICSFTFLTIERPAMLMGKRHYRLLKGLTLGLKERFAARIAL